MSKENGIYYLLIRGYTEFRDGDEYNGEWKYQIEPEIFMNMIQTINDNILDDEIKILEFSERKDKEEIIKSVMD